MNLKLNSLRFLVWWSNLNLKSFIGVTLLITYLIMIPMVIFHQSFDFVENRSDYLSIVLAVTLAPLLETLLFQSLVIYLIRKLLTGNLILQVLISGVVFGVTHYYNPGYIIFATLCGTVLATGYVLILRRRSWEDAACAIIIVHALRNSITVLVNLFLK